MNGRILIIDDNSEFAEKIASDLVTENFDFNFASTPELAFELLKDERIDLLLVNTRFGMEEGNGFFEQVKEVFPGIVVVALFEASDEIELITLLQERLIFNYISKSSDPKLITASIRNYLKIGKTTNIKKSIELSIALETAVNSMSKLAEFKDPETGNHIIRVKHYCKLIAKEMSKILKFNSQVTEEFIEKIFMFSSLHDIGKIGISDEILRKTGKLSEEEFSEMKRHTIIGGDSFESQSDEESSIVAFCRDIIYYHHEKFNGSGYPFKLKGKKIPLAARIMSLVDAYDAITSNRPYEEAKEHQVAITRIIKDKGIHFDPDIVDIFLGIEKEFDEIRIKYSDENFSL